MPAEEEREPQDASLSPVSREAVTMCLRDLHPSYVADMQNRARDAVQRGELKQGFMADDYIFWFCRKWGNDSARTRLNVSAIARGVQLGILRDFNKSATGALELESEEPLTTRKGRPRGKEHLPFSGLRCSELEISVASNGLRIKAVGQKGKGRLFPLEDFALRVGGDALRWLFEIAKNQRENATVFRPDNHSLKTRFNDRFSKTTGVKDNLLKSEGEKLIATAGRITC